MVFALFNGYSRSDFDYRFRVIRDGLRKYIIWVKIEKYGKVDGAFGRGFARRMRKVGKKIS